MIDRSTAITSIKRLNEEAFSLQPAALISLFEIDIGSIAFARGTVSQTEINENINIVFRFHNSVKLTTNSIFWQQKEFIAAPIQADGFELTAKGTLPTPKLSMTVSDEGIPHLSILKDRIFELGGDLVGAKVTRIRTFAKFLDAENYYDNLPPQGFLPDPNAEFARDVYFIDRKSAENKNLLEFELASILDVEGVKLPGRLVLSNTCPFIYRGEGCCYEYNSRRVISMHGNSGESILPEFAPAVATSDNEFIYSLISGFNISDRVDRGLYDKNISYISGNQTFITYNSVNYYFVAKKNSVNVSPPNLNYWISDQCSKNTLGCTFRFGLEGSAQGNITL
ncbi:MAG: phage minor tail protein L, partial [Nanoarchaeota archaeon]